MTTENLIAIEVICAHHNIEASFINSLQQTGLIQLTTIEDTGYIHTSELQLLEKFIRFHYELDINLEGIETITHLLNQMNEMQIQILALRNRLRLYEINE